MLYQSVSFAASCCGGGSGSSVIILGDNSQEFSFGYAFRNDIGQTDNAGFSSLHSSSIVDTQKIYNLQFTRVYFDRFQLAVKTGVTTKVLDKQGRQENKSGMQDVELQNIFEFLPEYSYSALKPRGFTYLKLTIPMSKSLYDSESALFSDVRGPGFYGLGSGLLFTKKVSQFSFKSGMEYQYFFGKEYSLAVLRDYYKVNIPFGISYGMESLPLILSLNSTWNYQSSKELVGRIQSKSPSEYFWDLNISSAYKLSDQSSVALSYSDSSIIGKSFNSPLYRTVGLSYNYGWAL